MKLNTRDLILTALFTALTIVGAYLIIPTQPVPISLQTLFVLLSGILLGSKLGALSQIVYILIGLIGLPVFAGGNGGLTMIAKPSFGYAIGFILGAYICGKIMESNIKSKLIKFSLAAIGGTIAIYLIGIPYLYFALRIVSNKILTFSILMKTGLIMFLPGDLIKAVIAVILSIQLVPILNKVILKKEEVF